MVTATCASTDGRGPDTSCRFSGGFRIRDTTFRVARDDSRTTEYLLIYFFICTSPPLPIESRVLKTSSRPRTRIIGIVVVPMSGLCRPDTPDEKIGLAHSSVSKHVSFRFYVSGDLPFERVSNDRSQCYSVIVSRWNFEKISENGAPSRRSGFKKLVVSKRTRDRNAVPVKTN